jgi:CRP-like cAMP-binding protein
VLAPLALPTLVDELREIALFGALSDDVLVFLAPLLSQRSLVEGEVLFREGEPGRELFVVRSGSIEISRLDPRGVPVTMTVARAGDWVGLVSLIDIQPRHNSAVALEPSSVFGLNSANLDALYRRDQKGYALLVMNMARELSRRLRIADACAVAR